MHHSLLHDDSRYLRRENLQTSTPVSNEETSVEICNTHGNYDNKTLLRYVPVLLHGHGKFVRTFAFLDDGSSVTLMEHDLLSELGLEGESYPLCLGWTADHQRQEDNSVKLGIGISGVHDRKVHWMPKVHTIGSLALPRQTLEVEELVLRYPHLKDLSSDSYNGAQPRILIGMDNCRLGYALDSKEGMKNEPIATRTRLGWVIFGPCSSVFYIEKLTESQLSEEFPRVWYLPIFPVINPNKPGKLRIVWDAAAKVAGTSLNSVLLTGPDQLTSLPSVLHRFREFRVAITGDIREMFHQVMVNRIDQQCQRFLWRDGNQDRSEESDEEAIKLAKDVRYVHNEGGFEIRNWLSNSKRVLRELEAEPGEKSFNLSSELGTEKVLGLWWCTSSDMFTFKLSPRINADLLRGLIVPTKRQILSTLMMIYDPLGLLANFLMFLKILLQEIWRSGVGWDDHIKSEQFKKWLIWLRVLPLVDSVSVPRMNTSCGERNNIQLHVFVDASENGFAAVAYLRFEEDGVVECALVGAKTRVAPLRFISIPRLELQAAVIGARLANHILKSHKLQPRQRFFWSDSRDVLCWLNSNHRKYSQFVAVRISEMLELTEPNEWNWIPSKLNVADDATKWQKLPDLSPSSRWFRGPEFLWKSKQHWPVLPSNNNHSTETPEEKRPYVFHHFAERTMFRWEDFSSWKRLLHHVAFVKCFPANLLRKLAKKSIVTGALTQEELKNAELFIIKIVQEAEFSSEIEKLKKPNPVPWKNVLPKSSKLYGLSPFIDNDGLLRMKGRIDACEFVGECTKYPILLPRCHSTTDLIIFDIHQRYCHINHQTTLNDIRRRFYVPKLRSAYKRVQAACQYCKNRKAKPAVPEMSVLPPMRLKPFCRPFSYIGIDYFGPMYAVVGRRTEKRWGVLITCLTVRVIHLEVAHSLTTDSCILAIRNFIARRGVPLEIISDRGTNFIGANRELKEALQQMNQNKLMEHFVTTDTKWSFNPPASPHFGGAWERLVQSVKKALTHLQITRNPTDELLRNMLAEVELIVNSRPLTELPLDDELSSPLTPNHFLLGSSNGSKSLVIFNDSSYTLNHTWRMSQVYANRFWERWVAEYLPTLTRRTKWFSQVKPIETGDIVILVD
ncbi:uncharacterized protein LOC129761435 [Toxorhynchites rutilus septentrionalis]|uniref:uncharacterized protein LOC129761435 n=1 Tax=Toxorhynchites rutilus septentrionalis TaxID=329112 RepID=UPI002478B2CE|nr:uncharacterized protein LOC129761435 [Toxorhynchites rutilus septentrionalis]